MPELFSLQRGQCGEPFKEDELKCYHYIFFSPRVIAWLNEVATVAHNNTSRRFGKKKNPRIIASELNLEWKHLFQAFLTWFRRKNDFGGVENWEKRTKEKTEQTAYIKTTRELFGVRHESENKNKIKLASG